MAFICKFRLGIRPYGSFTHAKYYETNGLTNVLRKRQQNQTCASFFNLAYKKAGFITKGSKMMQNMYISWFETGMSATQKTVVSGLNMLCLWVIHLGGDTP